jgi:phthiocerol/phenolphthiocerol synthesis type-I polyketide synthase E
MFDIALASGAWFVGEAGDGAFYLPFEYAGVELKARCPAAVWSHIRRITDEPDPDAVSFAVTLLDADGWELATVGRYTLKRVSATNGARPEAPAADSSEDILPAEGLDALSRILAAPPQPQIVVSAVSLDYRIAEAAPGASGGDAGGEAPDSTLSAYPRPSLSTPYEEPASEIERTIGKVWEGILGIADIGADDHFTELGGNSLLAVQAAASISDTYQLELTVEAFLAAPTVRGVADTVVGLLVSLASGDTLESLLADLEGSP